ncbi:monocarboxylate transporter 12-like isoform X2 [Biomphalaria glabrata]|uniref:Monocarboxylate transporter 12-like isoform X2 n=1 Tax=Biomphalaria glabrata TaxID=6526 RepID=A0A9U8EA74_BIOGL|nr:monocarboxylate transporter 12-like isoform X2 [Biomphalaria glabrata]
MSQLNHSRMSQESVSDRPGDLRKQVEKLNKDFQSVSGSVVSTSNLLNEAQNVQKDSTWAWVACSCAVMNQLLIFGTLNVYSLFLVKFQKEFQCSTGEAAWLGSMTMGLMKLFGPLTSSLVLYGNNRVVMIFGAVLCSVSIFTSSFAPTFMTLFGTLCVPFALGAAFTVTPSTVVPVDYFHKHQALAMGFVAAGSSVGTLILAPLIQIMLDELNWRLTFRIHSSSLASLVLLNFLVKPIEKDKAEDEIKKPFLKSVIQDLALWKNRVFQLWAFSMAIVYFGYQIPNILLASYAGFLGISASRASYIVMAMGGATTVSRLITGKILTCQLLSRLNFKQTIFIVMGTSYLLLAHVTTIEGLYVFAVVRGLLDGAHNVMLPMLTASMVGRKKAMLGWGYIAGAISLTYTIGPPIAGYVKDLTGNYKMSFTMAGLPMIASGLLLLWLPWAQRAAKSNAVEPTTGSLVNVELREEDLHSHKHSSHEELELMPIDIPDISPKPKLSGTHRKSEAVTIGAPFRKDLHFWHHRAENNLSKSLSMPEARQQLDSNKWTYRIRSEPTISIKGATEEPAASPLLFPVSKRKSGPLTASYSDSQSNRSASLHSKDLKSEQETSQINSESGEHFLLKEDE